jgi:hypothetical protein
MKEKKSALSKEEVKYKNPRFKLVVVEWIDACIDADDDQVEPAVGKTVGWLLKPGKKHGKTFVRVASEAFEDGTFRYITAILSENVNKIVELKAK